MRVGDEEQRRWAGGSGPRIPKLFSRRPSGGAPLSPRAGTLLLLLSLLLSVPDVPAAPEAPEAEGTFAFAVIADPHIYGRPANDERLRDAVRWINEHRDSRRIELVFVLGDVTWRHGQAVRARRILEGLSVPWVPLIGDNEMMEGSEREFHLAFALQYRRLTRSLAGFGWAPTPVVDPATGRAAFLQNFVLDHRGVRFVGLDWVTRSGGDSAEFHDYPGGTWRWFVQSVDGAPSGPDERVVLLSHLPMHFNLVYEVFSREEYRRLAAYLGSRRRSVYADFAGHYHIDWRERKADGAYWLFVTDATFEDVNRLRLVTVTRGEEAFEYEHALIDVPAAPSGSGR